MSLQNAKLLNNEKLGRYLAANKDLEAGEVILTDKPFTVGPKSDTPVLCLGCYCPCDGSYLCTRCRWPCCDAACQEAPAHKDHECGVFLEAGVQFQPVEDYTESCVQYDCITPLRVLLAKERDPSRWESQVAGMEDHDAERRSREATWNVDNINITLFLEEKCKLYQRFPKEIIQKVCGILEVNSVEIPSRGGFSVRAVYPQMAIMAHNCIPNIVHTIRCNGDANNPDYSVEVRAAVPIKEGDILYLCYTYTLYPTLVRRDFLVQSKFFECDCRRCADPTECNTQMSTLKCNKCDNGLLLSTNPIDAESEWKCTHCEFRTSGVAMRKLLGVIQAEIEATEETSTGPAAIEHREQVLRKYRGILHPKHAFLISLKYSLAQLYGRADGYQLDELPDIMLERKAELCREVLQVLDVIAPGYSRVRGMTLYELHAPLMFLARNEFKAGLIDNEKLKKKLAEPVTLLEKSVLILKNEDSLSPEGIIGQVAAQSLEQLKASLESLE